MLKNVLVHPQDDQPLVNEEIQSSISPQLLEFCNPEFFPETIQNSEPTSCSNHSCEENKFNSRLKNNNGDTINTTNNNTPGTASIDFSPLIPTINRQQDQFHNYTNSVVQPQTPLHLDPAAPNIMGAPILSDFEDVNLSCSVPNMGPCSFVHGPAMAATDYMQDDHGNSVNVNSLPTIFADGTAIFTGNHGIVMGSDLQPHEGVLDYQGESCGVYSPDSMQRIFNFEDLQGLNTECQQLMGGAGNPSLAAEGSNMEDSTFKVRKLTVEERKEKIHRYLKKRNERNFSKKIKYACRKRLADSRPRVRGRFAKNDEFGDSPRAACRHHEEDEDDDDEIVGKEEDEMVDSSDILAHISGVNSFKSNYAAQSWVDI